MRGILNLLTRAEAPPTESHMTSGQWCTTANMHSAMAVRKRSSPKIRLSRMLLVRDWKWVPGMFWSWTASTNAVSALRASFRNFWYCLFQWVKSVQKDKYVCFLPKRRTWQVCWCFTELTQMASIKSISVTIIQSAISVDKIWSRFRRLLGWGYGRSVVMVNWS